MKTTYYQPTLTIKSRTETIGLERLIGNYHNEAMANMNNHFGPKMMEELTKAGNFQNIEFLFCGRLKRSLGQAKTMRNDKSVGRIKMHKKFFLTNSDKLDVMRNTYIHELAHVVVNRIYGRTQRHNDNWRKLFMILGGNGETFHDEDVARYSRPYVYTCQCPDGNNTHHLSPAMHKRSTVNPERYSCKQCRAKIQFNYAL